MKHLAIASVLVSVMALSALASAEEKTGMDLKERCVHNITTDSDLQRDAWCRGFIYGYFEFSRYAPVPVGRPSVNLNWY
jgi:hypothetical protein